MYANNTGKKKIKLNLVDIILIAVIAAAAVFLVYMIFFSDRALIAGKSKQNLVKLEITYKISMTDNILKVDIKQGDEAVSADKNYVIGKVKAVSEPTMSKAIVPNEKDINSRTKYYEYPDRYDFTVTVSAEAVIEGDNYLIDGNAVRVGETILFNTPYFTAEAVCEKILVVEEGGAK